MRDLLVEQLCEQARPGFIDQARRVVEIVIVRKRVGLVEGFDLVGDVPAYIAFVWHEQGWNSLALAKRRGARRASRARRIRLKLTAASWTTEEIRVGAEELGCGRLHRFGRFAGIRKSCR